MKSGLAQGKKRICDAGPSTPLRSAQDDIVLGKRWFFL
jgi:hypothetical protein